MTDRKRTVVADVESDGLLPKLTKLHCAVAIDVETEEVLDWTPDTIDEFPRFLEEECECFIGHNIIDFDIRALRKVYPSFNWTGEVGDTLVMTRLVWPSDTLIGRDMRLKNMGLLPPRLIKSHSLKAWGIRLGNRKADYTGPWDVWSREMHDYMIQDGHVNLDLLKLIRKRVGWDDPKPNTYVWPKLPFEIEHGVAEIIREQQDTGFAFDRERAIKLAQELQNRKADLEERLVDHFGSWWAPKDNPITGTTPKRSMKRKMKEFPDVTMKRFGKKGQELKPYVGPPLEYVTAGAPYVRIERVTFSPSSRDHIGQRLQVDYGWKPKAFGANGKPTVDEGTVKTIPDDVLPPALRQNLLDFFVANKTLGQLSVGRKSWLRACGDDSRIHGRMNTCGAITGRGIHFEPNLSQTPSVQHEDDGVTPKLGLAGGYGWECRALFTATLGWELTGADVSSLELVELGHYLTPFDGGEFAERVSDPDRDPHTEHGELTGLNRRDTKTVTYLKVYGGGAWKAAHEMEVGDEEVADLLQYRPLANVIAWRRKMEGPDFQEPDDKFKAKIAKGHKVIKKFEAAITGLKDLIDDITSVARQRKWVKGLDGRKLYVRKPHAALNTLMQGGGAIICKLWMILLHAKLKEMGLKPGVDFRQVVWSHDELQVEHKPGLGGTVGEASQAAIQEAGKILGIRAKLRTEHKTGRNWAETH